MALTAPERETVIVWSDEDEAIKITTSQRRIITQIKNNNAAKIISETVFDGSPIVEALLPLGSITIRKKAVGTVKRNSTAKRTGMPSNAARCSGTKADGSPCGSLASRVTGRCKAHPA